MRNIAASLIALLLAAGIAALTDERRGTLHGAIARVDAETSTLALKISGVWGAASGEVALSATERTKILKHGDRVGLGEVHAGDRVVVDYEERDGARIAVRIGIEAGPAES